MPYELVEEGWGVDGQTYLFLRKVKREITSHNPHRVNNTRYYAQIQEDQPLINPMQMVVLLLNLIPQSVQNALVLTFL
jgi:hypothetical protein